MSHPSFLELDRHALGAGQQGTAEHLSGCARCRDYVEAARPAAEVPVWVGELAAPRRRSRPIWLAATLAAAAALMLLWKAPGAEPAYVGSKGMPSAFVYVNRDHTTTLWDHLPLRPGDRIRVEVAPEEFEHVAVFSTDALGGAPTRLFAGRTKPFSRTLLPKAWQLDAEGDAEHLAILFSHAELSEGVAAALLHAHDPAELRIVRLTLPKK
jgi:hypothetical protein